VLVGLSFWRTQEKNSNLQRASGRPRALRWLPFHVTILFSFRLTGDICMFSDHLLINCSMIMVIPSNVPSFSLRSAIDDDQKRARARENVSHDYVIFPFRLPSSSDRLVDRESPESSRCARVTRATIAGPRCERRRAVKNRITSSPNVLLCRLHTNEPTVNQS
jgi:hypothetical protein